jgi:hypothetical protein
MPIVVQSISRVLWIHRRLVGCRLQNALADEFLGDRLERYTSGSVSPICELLVRFQNEGTVNEVNCISGSQARDDLPLAAKGPWDSTLVAFEELVQWL